MDERNKKDIHRNGDALQLLAYCVESDQNMMIISINKMSEFRQQNQCKTFFFSVLSVWQ